MTSERFDAQLFGLPYVIAGRMVDLLRPLLQDAILRNEYEVENRLWSVREVLVTIRRDARKVTLYGIQRRNG